ncbi:hypothetical protein BASA81_008263 [Batrachochytrium salamandrivorans]|nr:hypothetical protein BASA81_008263 [Batrachochytrium salamandrivorans]
MLKPPGGNPQAASDRTAGGAKCPTCARIGSIRSPLPSFACPSKRHHHHHHVSYGQVTKCEVLQHSQSPSDCWIVCEDRVYDVGRYLKEHTHPGGERAFLKRQGGAMDCTRDYNFHSA